MSIPLMEGPLDDLQVENPAVRDSYKSEMNPRLFGD